MLVDNQVVYLPIYCDHYDPETKLCTIYDHRHESNRRCLTVAEGIHYGVFPPECPYVRDVPGYVPPREECIEEELREYFEHGGSDEGSGKRD